MPFNSALAYATIDGDAYGRRYVQGGSYYKADGTAWSAPSGITDVYTIGRRNFGKGDPELVNASTLGAGAGAASAAAALVSQNAAATSATNAGTSATNAAASAVAAAASAATAVAAANGIGTAIYVDPVSPTFAADLVSALIGAGLMAGS